MNSKRFSRRTAQPFGSMVRLAWLVLSAAALARPAFAVEDAQALLERHRCAICHDEQATKAGPSYREIAARHRGDPRAQASVVAVIAQGKHGAALWPMPPSQVPPDEARAMAAYILARPPRPQ